MIYLWQAFFYLIFLLVQCREDLAGEAGEVPASLSVKLEEVGVELGQGRAVSDGQQGHSLVLGRLRLEMRERADNTVVVKKTHHPSYRLMLVMNRAWSKISKKECGNQVVCVSCNLLKKEYAKAVKWEMSLVDQGCIYLGWVMWGNVTLARIDTDPNTDCHNHRN